jgi:competence protein ComEA
MKIFTLLAISISFLFAAVDINNASIKELSTLKGVGPSKAEAIVTFRKTHCFKNVHELSLVKGIGNKTIEKNKADLKAGACAK